MKTRTPWIPRQRLVLSSLLSVGLLAGCSGAPQSEADFVSDWEISSIQDTGIRGVSPELLDIDGDLTLFVTTLDPDKVWSVGNDGAFSPSGKDLPPGADFTVVDEGENWRLYWADFIDEPDPGQPMSPDARKQVVTATTTDFVSYSEPVPTGVQQDTPGPAWGVPDTVVGPDGVVHMYWVDEVEGESFEVIRHASSTNGTDFTVTDEPVMVGGYVDPFVLTASDEEWLMLVSTTPHPSELPQKLHIARSGDGLSWEVDPTPLLTEPETNYLDPTAHPLDSSTWQVVFSTSPKDQPLNPDEMTLQTARLRLLP